MLIKPRMFVLVIVVGLGWLAALAGLVIGVAGLLGGHSVYAGVGLGLFLSLWAIRLWAEKNRAVIARFLDGA